MLRVGLTGGIGSGKSSVVAMLRGMGVAGVEADGLGHEVSRAGGPGYDGNGKAFGRLRVSEGSIDWIPANGQLPRRIYWNELADYAEHNGHSVR